MATPTYSKSVSYHVLHAFLLLLLCPFLCMKYDAVEGTKPRFHTLKIGSHAQQSDVCNESPIKVQSTGSTSLKVIHKYGPCNPNRPSTAPSFAEILRPNKLRAESIAQARKSRNSAHGVMGQKPKLGVPFYRLSKVDPSGDYYVNVGVGTQKTELPLIFDTGSGLIWTQCKPCKPCYKDVPVYDPSKSASYKDVSCPSQTCHDAQKSQGNPPICSGAKCAFEISYVSNASFSGRYAKETITIGSSAKHTVLMACATKMNDISGGQSGIIGLDLNPSSFPSQTAHIYNNIFPYCIPSNTASTGHLTFGGDLPKDLKFGQVRNKTEEFYDISLTGITIGGRKPLTNAKYFKIAYVTVNSGTDFSLLPNKAYSTLVSEFRAMMKEYGPVFGSGVLDTCYDFSGHSSVSVPAITLFFENGIEFDIDVSGIMVPISPEYPTLYCLGFSPYGDEPQLAILGNVQQRTYTIFYDGGKRRVGFIKGGCH